MAILDMKMDKRYRKTWKSQYERFDFRAGVLDDKPYRLPKPIKRNQTSKSEIGSAIKKVQNADKREKKPKKFSNRVLVKVKKFFGKKKTKSKKSTQSPKAKILKRSKKSRSQIYRDMGLSTMEGGPVRRKGTKTRGMISDVSNHIRRHTPYLTAPFKKENAQIRSLRKAMFQLITGKAKSYSKVETALRAVIRTPILKQSYGRNKPSTIKTKGFNRYLIDTGQFYRAINARVRVRAVKGPN